MRVLIITILLFSCGQLQPSKNRTALTTAEEIYQLKLRVTKAEQDNINIKRDFKKSDSLNAIADYNIGVKVYSLTGLRIKDSISVWRAIPKIINTNLAQDIAISSVGVKVYNLIKGKTKDSVAVWLAINKTVSIPARFQRDSVYQWVAIKKLQGASPVIQIPILQSQMKALTTLVNDYGTSLNLNDFTITNNVASVKGYGALINLVNALVDRITALEQR